MACPALCLRLRLPADEVAMQGAIEAAGTTCTLVSAFLSKAPSIPVVRRHARSEGGQFHFAPAVQVCLGEGLAVCALPPDPSVCCHLSLSSVFCTPAIACQLSGTRLPLPVPS